MRSLDDFAVRKLAELDRASLRRTLAESFRGEGPWIERDGRRLLSFSCNDYLNLSHHPALKSAATATIAQYGVGAFKCCNMVYNPPGRNYAFDTDFTDPSKMPPGTPRFIDVVNVDMVQDLKPR